MYADENSLTIVLVMSLVWSLLGLGLYVWYLAALASLFPRIGLPAGEGWIPVWNESRILQRGGFSPWLVLLMFVPGVSIAFVVLRAIAIHRLHTELGKGVGLTVLAVLIPPLWATMLASQLRAASPAQTAAGYQAGSVFAPSVTPGQAAPAYPMTDAAAQPGAYPQPAAPNPWAAAPAVPLQDAAQYDAAPAPETPAFDPSAYAAPAYTPPAYSAPAPAQPGYQSHASDESAFAAPEPATPVAQAPAGAAFETLGFDTLMAQASADAGAPPAETPAAPGAPAFQTPAPDAPWGFGRETEDAYQQLSTQEIQPLTLPFSGESPVEPFTWPGTVGEMPVAPQSAEAFAVPTSAWAAPAVPASPEAPTAEIPAIPAAPAPTAQAASAAAHAEAPVAVPAVAEAPDAPAILPVTPAPAAAEGGLDDDLDHTVFVRREPRERWVLELPDGSLLPLPGNDVIVGRRPSSSGESSVLVIPDSTRTLSKSHVRLHVIKGAWVVTDLGSTNGLAVIDETGEELVVEAGKPEPATEEMMFGTLRVRLRLVALDG